ncbi:MAG TPA: dephospho-CoA kinase [Candidatus Saccharimonadales bacterium]|nr:dephospho-CoA kinase [Candidatus Saccharimonadales bacterium]
MTGLLKVGLTGGIACGRSTVARSLDRPGWLHIDADRIVHALLADGGRAAEPVLETFGSGVKAAGGGVDRRLLAGLVFSDHEARRKLESIIHPLVYEVIDSDIASFEKRTGAGIVVVDAALMVETGSWRRYHRLVVVHCPPEIQIRRLMARDGLGREDARRRIAAQAPLAEKVALADYAIDTGSTLEATRQRASEVAASLEEDLRALPGLPSRRGGSAS